MNKIGLDLWHSCCAALSVGIARFVHSFAMLIQYNCENIFVGNEFEKKKSLKKTEIK